MNRKKFLKTYLISFLILGFIIYFGLKNISQKNFSSDKLENLTTSVSIHKDKVTDLCKYQILGEPKVEKQYIKINFWCQNRSEAHSTLSLAAISNPTVEGVLQEYARIINFDYNFLKQEKWRCLINDKEISNSNINASVDPASTIDCYQTNSI